MGQLAYVLHSSKYSETSVLLDLFVRGEGITKVLHRGAKRKKQQPMQMGVCYSVERVGKRGLKTLVAAEPVGAVSPIYGEQQYLLFYLNELNVRLTRDTDLSERLFDQYQAIVDALRHQLPVEPYLRAYELALFSEIGYASTVLYHPDQIDHAKYYGVTSAGDLRVADGHHVVMKQPVIRGDILSAIAQADWGVENALVAAKHLNRTLINIRLNGKPLKSRELYIRYREAVND